MATSWRSLFTEQITEQFGYVSTLEEADRLLNFFLSTTSSQFVIYKVDAKHFGNTAFNTKCRKLNWECEATKFHEAIPYNGTPYMKVNQKILNCQFGRDKSGNRRREMRAQKQLDRESDEKTKKDWSNFISENRDCPANISLTEVIQFPDFTLEEDSEKGRQFVTQYFFDTLKRGDVKWERRIYVSVPSKADHQFHPFLTDLAKNPKVRSAIRTQSKMRGAVASYNDGGVENISIKNIPVFIKARNNEVVIEVYASTFTREDSDKINNLTAGDGPHVLGCEASGIVTATGHAASKWSVGDRVMAYLPHGGCAKKVTVNEDHVMPVPSWMTLHSAAALPQSWLTAYHLLTCHDTSMNAGDIVLIHAGASGVGTALVQLVTMAGGCAIVTAGSQAKIDICKSVGATAGFCYKLLDFGKEIAKYLDGRLVNVIFDPVGGTHWQLNCSLLADHGSWIIYGLLSGPYIAGDLRPLITRNVTIKTSFLRSKSHEYTAELITSFTEKVLPYFRPNSEFELKAVINRFYPLQMIDTAHKFLESNQSVGKLVITVRGEIIKAEKKSAKTTRVDTDAEDGAGTCSQVDQASWKLAMNQQMINYKSKGRSEHVRNSLLIAGNSQIPAVCFEKLVEST